MGHGLVLRDVLLLDIHLPGMLGSEGARVLCEKHPALQIRMLTVYDEEERIFESICSSIYDKLHVYSKTEAVRKALRQGIIQ